VVRTGPDQVPGPGVGHAEQAGGLGDGAGLTDLLEQGHLAGAERDLLSVEDAQAGLELVH
jgi:hypothetical protein